MRPENSIIIIISTQWLTLVGFLLSEKGENHVNFFKRNETLKKPKNREEIFCGCFEIYAFVIATHAGFFRGDISINGSLRGFDDPFFPFTQSCDEGKIFYSQRIAFLLWFQFLKKNTKIQ